MAHKIRMYRRKHLRARQAELNAERPPRKKRKKRDSDPVPEKW